jgi:phosphatidylglycerophosphatase A
LLLACGFGTGLLPRAPGTFGTLAAVPLYLLLSGLALGAYVALVAGLALAGVPLCRHAADRLGTHDHPSIVFDEVVGYLVTMVAAPQGWQAVVLGFLLFRLFDIWKPWPIRWLDRSVGGGLGIMLDDVAAGALGCAVLQVVATLWS